MTHHESSAAPWDRTNERGSYAVLSGVLIASLVGLAAFSVDISLITMAELQVQATADAASHAALVRYRTSAGNQAQGIAAANWIVGKDKVAMGIANVDNVTFGRWNYTAKAFAPAATQINAAQATVSRRAANSNAVELLLAPILGINQYDVSATSVTAEQLRAMMLVMDMSCSMMTGNIGQANSPVNVGRVANIGFLDYLIANPSIGDQLGLSMFAQWANRTPTSTAPAGTRVNTNYPTRVADPPWLPLSLLETQQALVRQRINGICDTQVSAATLCVPGAPHPVSGTIGNTTNPGPAMFQAVNELTNTAKVNATYFKGMLFFSDGWPNAGLGAAGGTQAANLAWTNDIYVWTILFANGGGSPAYMTSLVRGAPLAFSQTSGNVADMPAMYQAVAKSLPTALVY
jgi:Flp pilus assembly protein TadG